MTGKAKVGKDPAVLPDELLQRAQAMPWTVTSMQLRVLLAELIDYRAGKRGGAR